MCFLRCKMVFLSKISEIFFGCNCGLKILFYRVLASLQLFSGGWGWALGGRNIPYILFKSAVIFEPD